MAKLAGKKNELGRVLILTAVMVGITFSVLGIALFTQYQSTFEQQKNWLMEVVRSQKSLMESVAGFDARYSTEDVEGGAFAATMSQIVEAHETLRGFGKTGEFLVGRLGEDSVTLILDYRHPASAGAKWIPLRSNPDEPMRRALSGKSGWFLGPDYRGETVLAVYEPIAILNLGLVAKMDLSEIRAPFFESAIYAGGIAVVLIVLGSIFVVRSGSVLLRRLERSEADLARAQNITHLGSWTLDLERNELHWYDEVYRILGLRPQEFEATYEAFLNSVHPEDSEFVKRSVNEALYENRPYDIEYRIVRPDGSVRMVHEQSDIIFGAEGKPVKIVGVVHDITERKQAEAEVRKYQSNLERLVEERTEDLERAHRKLLHSEKLAAVGKLSAFVAHEFNNPLAGIQSVLEEVEVGSGIGGEYKELVRIGIMECRRIADLIQKLQDFNRPSTGRFERVDLREAINEILPLFTKKLKEKNIRLEINFPESLPEVNAVRDQIKQVILNLLQNAEEAIQDGEGVIRLALENVGSELKVTVEDTGCGISGENTKNIFEPFFTTKSSAKGTGLGLSICDAIIKSHGGDIAVKSKAGAGTIMVITFGALEERL